MGDLRPGGGGPRPGVGASGSWGGTRRGRLTCALHSHTYGAIDISRWVTALNSQKRIDGSPGSWDLAVRSRGLPGEAPVDWLPLVSDDDWVVVRWWDGQRSWLVMVGVVDRVGLTIQSSSGARTNDWSIEGRDLTKPMAETEAALFPWLRSDELLGGATFYQEINGLAAPGATPSDVVERLLTFFVRGNISSENAWWRVPPSIPSELFPGRPVRQFSDILDRKIGRTVGEFGAYPAILSLPNSGGNAWDVLRSFCNETLNELWVDLVDDRPTIILRERPFATLPGTATHRAGNDDPWSEIPATIVGITDVASANLSRGGDERYNFFLVDSGTGGMANKLVTQALATGDPLGDVPAYDRESIAVHGLRRLETSSSYINIGGSGIDLYAEWSRIYRDWYCLNHEFLSGRITLGFLAPGVRVGERLVVHGLVPGGATQFYVEAVAHRIDVSVPLQTTTITVSRGHPDPVAGLRRHLAAVVPPPGPPVGAGAPATGSPVGGGETRPVAGETGGGEHVEIPASED